MKYINATTLGITMLLVALYIIILPAENHLPQAEAKYNSVSHSLKTIGSERKGQWSHSKQASTETALIHKEIVFLTDKFMKMITQEADDQYKVRKHSSKQSLIDAFQMVTSKEIARNLVDFYYEERNDGLYIIPTETPPWFQSDVKYEKIKVDENKVRVIQENKSDLHGNYKLEIEFTFGEHWQITSIKYY